MTVEKTSSSSRAPTVWLTGLPAAGKSTLGRNVAEQLQQAGEPTEFLDGDIIRAHLGPNLGFTRQDREENLRRITFVAELLTRHGVTTVVAAIAPYRSVRDQIRMHLSPFVEVFVNAPLAVCEQRDGKGLYRRYRNGELKGLTGLDDIYEEPLSPEVECRTDLETVDQSVAKILDAIRAGRIKSIEKILNHQTQSSVIPK